MIPQFALRLLCGLSLMWLVMPRRQVSSGFFRIQLLVTLGLAVLAVLSVGQLPVAALSSADPAIAAPWLDTGGIRRLAILAAVVSFAGSVLWTLERRTAGTIAGTVVFVLSTIALLAGSSSFGQATGTPLLTAGAELASAALLGSVVAGMLLGHWYLTAPTMSHDPLWRMTLLVGVAAAARLLASAIALGQLPEFPAGTALVWLSLRWLAGLFGPLVAAAMTWKILGYRNTQSATGVLFVGVILVFIGEMTAALLQRELGLPL